MRKGTKTMQMHRTDWERPAVPTVLAIDPACAAGEIGVLSATAQLKEPATDLVWAVATINSVGIPLDAYTACSGGSIVQRISL